MSWTPLAKLAKLRPAKTPQTKEPRLVQRYEPCRILTKHGLANVLWFEDALAHYGSDTLVFDLYVLVANVTRARKTLIRFGYKKSSEGAALPAFDDRSCRGGVRLERPGEASDDGVVLLSNEVWKCDLKQHSSSTPPLPPLNRFLDSLMSYWLRMSEDEFAKNLLWSMSLASLIHYAYDLKSPEGQTVRTVEFAQRLQPEHRELHYDIVGNYPQKTGICSYRKHEYHAMRCKEIGEGTFTPRPYPSSNIPVSLAEYPHLTGLNARHEPSKAKKGTKLDRLHSIDEVL